MSMKDGGPAFPMPIAGCNDGSVYNTMEQSAGEFGGMTLRDYFAAKAMQTILTGSKFPTKADRDEWLPILAEVAYEAADAMLVARDSTGNAG